VTDLNYLQETSYPTLYLTPCFKLHSSNITIYGAKEYFARPCTRPAGDGVSFNRVLIRSHQIPVVMHKRDEVKYTWILNFTRKVLGAWSNHHAKKTPPAFGDATASCRRIGAVAAGGGTWQVEVGRRRPSPWMRALLLRACNGRGRGRGVLFFPRDASFLDGLSSPACNGLL
jgi:hypothetical protein